MFKDWIRRYIRYWYNHPKPYEYYGANPKTKYCYGGCYNGLKNAWKAYNVLHSKNQEMKKLKDILDKVSLILFNEDFEELTF